MNILVITTFYPHPERNDLLRDTSAIHYIAREWVQQGHQVTVLHCYGHYFRELIKELGKHDFRQYGKVQECPENEGVKVLLIENQFWLRNAKWYLPFQQRRIAKAINHYFHEKQPNYQPDVLLVHFPTNYVGIVERLDFSCRKAAVFHKTDVATVNAKPWVCPRIQSTYDLLGARTGQLQKKLAKVGIKTSFLAQSGIDESLIMTDAAFQKKWSAEVHPIKIVYAGNLVRDKKVDAILAALGSWKDRIPFEFTVIGDGICMPSCIKLAQTLGIAGSCRFTGRMTREKKLAEFRKADVFVMISRLETLGLVYLEAMSQGCIVIGSKNEGIDGIIVDQKNGYLVESGNAEELRMRLEYIAAASEDEKKSIAYAGVQTIRQMTSKKTAEQYLDQVLGTPAEKAAGSPQKG